MDQQILLRGQSPDDIDIHPCRQHAAPADAAFGDPLGAALAQRRGQPAILPRDLQLDEAPVRAALFLEIGVVHDVTVLEDDDLVADLFNVAQQVRAEQHTHSVIVLELLDEVEHTRPSFRIQPVGRFVQNDELG